MRKTSFRDQNASLLVLLLCFFAHWVIVLKILKKMIIIFDSKKIVALNFLVWMLGCVILPKVLELISPVDFPIPLPMNNAYYSHFQRFSLNSHEDPQTPLAHQRALI